MRKLQNKQARRAKGFLFAIYVVVRTWQKMAIPV